MKYLTQKDLKLFANKILKDCDAKIIEKNLKKIIEATSSFFGDVKKIFNQV
jgi:hypothetical protein|tara:strand:+ start:112 stop:264 length:153 start_codon:yes stop_codon:yes gene_type:complete